MILQSPSFSDLPPNLLLAEICLFRSMHVIIWGNWANKGKVWGNTHVSTGRHSQQLLQSHQMSTRLYCKCLFTVIVCIFKHMHVHLYVLHSPASISKGIQNCIFTQLCYILSHTLSIFKYYVLKNRGRLNAGDLLKKNIAYKHPDSFVFLAL